MCKEEWGKAIDKAIFPGIQGGPLMHIIAAKAVAFKEALSPEFKVYQANIVKNAAAMADEFKKLGVKMVSGGTDNHLILLNLTDKNITGKELEHLLDEVHITVNKNAIPFDTQKPFVTSGIRIGTPAMTTRGMGENESREIARLIAEVIEKREACFDDVSAKVAALCKNFPLYDNCVR
jgi:glycine hydroxymethyltransferase